MAGPVFDRTSAVLAITKQKAEAIRLAKEQGAAVNEMSKRAKAELPPYTFEELIGKGAYGRVYKGHHLPSQKVVAIKVLEVDTPDYQAVRDFKDESIKDFIHESRVMQRVKDSGAKNINMIIEAISIHSQLWLVCDYCPGGSVKTLMRATGDKLEEKFIIPIARELAEGLRAIHEAGIIHRDVKAGNVLIHEEGRLQICDFGVAGVLQSNIDKRKTWIGTPHWMPPEMFSTRMNDAPGYGSEVDVWAYGCTLFECGTGAPPNANLRERMQIGRQLSRNPPKLEGDSYSEELRSLVSFALTTDPACRPTMKDILQHPYVLNTEETYPTSSLSELVRIYYQWTQSGGQRISLFNPGGAMAAEFPGSAPFDDEDWNFSTTDNFERRFSLIDFDQLSASLSYFETNSTSHDNSRAQPPLRDPFEDMSQDLPMTAAQQANFDERVKRGAVAMEGLFDEAKPDYKYVTKNDFVPVEERTSYSDLPLRSETDRSSVASTFLELNLGAFDSSHYAAGTTTAPPPAQLADALTIKASRCGDSEYHSSMMDTQEADDSEDGYQYQQPSGPRPPTMEWTFPQSMSVGEEAPTEAAYERPDGPRPPTMEWSFPAAAREDDSSKPEKESVKDTRPATMEWTFPDLLKETNESSQTDSVTVQKDRPPTMAWTFPSMTQEDPSATVRESRVAAHRHFAPHMAENSDADVEDGADSGPGEIVIDSPSASPDDRKGDIGTWNVTAGSESAEKRENHGQWQHSGMHSDSKMHSLPKIETDYSYRDRNLSISRSISRPSTAASSDTDPFRFDGPGSPIVHQGEQESSTPVPVAEGHSPAIEEVEKWQPRNDLTARQASRDVGIISPSQLISPQDQSLQSLANYALHPPTSNGAARATTSNDAQSANAPPATPNSAFFSAEHSPSLPPAFPAVASLNVAALEPDMSDEAVVSELDKLLSSFMGGLSATHDILVRCKTMNNDTEQETYIK
ncbi:hypothetical protein KEM54_000643 [Ascosphaera aggregata]|nr:hypothetical protein KEM54_000643 [Ascosphaera aggregata]